ncbi:UbiD family decarboxylase [Natrialba swarupiae]|nr:UbiD family decarboxylase [Natrialba swarupiae]
MKSRSLPTTRRTSDPTSRPASRLRTFTQAPEVKASTGNLSLGNASFRCGHQKSDALATHIASTQRKEPTEMAIVIGASPSVIFGSIANVGHDIDKYSVAGGLMNESVELVPGETIDVDVPAHAEIVIETLIHGDEKNPEAPFGEYPGVYSEQNENTPRVEVTGIMRREDAIYDTVLTGLPPNEDGMMNWIPAVRRYAPPPNKQFRT